MARQLTVHINIDNESFTPVTYIPGEHVGSDLLGFIVSRSGISIGQNNKAVYLIATKNVNEYDVVGIIVKDTNGELRYKDDKLRKFIQEVNDHIYVWVRTKSSGIFPDEIFENYNKAAEYMRFMANGAKQLFYGMRWIEGGGGEWEERQRIKEEAIKREIKERRELEELAEERKRKTEEEEREKSKKGGNIEKWEAEQKQKQKEKAERAEERSKLLRQAFRIPPGFSID